MPVIRDFRAPLTAPGPTGAEMVSSIGMMRSDPVGFLAQQWRAHGDLVQLPIPRPAVYLVSSPDDVRTLLVGSARATSKRTLQYDNLADVTGQGLLTSDGELWRTHRRVAQASFNQGLIEKVTRVARELTAGTINKWHRMPPNSIVDVEEEMMQLTLQVVATALFGSRWEGQAGVLARATLDALDCVVRRARQPIPLPLWVPSPTAIRLLRARRRLDTAVGELIRSHDVAPASLVTELAAGLRLADGTLDERAVRDELVTFLIAGHETVASALTSTIALLGTDGHLQRQLAVDEQLAQSIIWESLRLYPPAWVISRRLTTSVDLSEQQLPAGALVIISPWIVHRHPRVWTHPQEFDAQRFLTHDPRRTPGYLPFGLGARMCIGREFAIAESTAILMELAAHFQFRGVGAIPEMEASVTLRPRGGLPMRVSQVSG